MALAIAKLLFCVGLAFAGVALYVFGLHRPNRLKYFRRQIVLVTMAKIGVWVVVYSAMPEINSSSDAAMYYLPEARRLLAGGLPYRDFATSYGPLFSPLVALPLLVWDSVGAIVGMMLLIETGMVVMYFYHFRQSDVGCRTLFLYVWSPISVYWVTLTGYNGVIIGATAVGALLLASAKRDPAAGLMAVFGFLASKMLAVLSWPAIVLFGRGLSPARLLPMMAAPAFLAVLV